MPPSRCQGPGCGLGLINYLSCSHRANDAWNRHGRLETKPKCDSAGFVDFDLDYFVGDSGKLFDSNHSVD